METVEDVRLVPMVGVTRETSGSQVEVEFMSKPSELVNLASKLNGPADEKVTWPDVKLVGAPAAT